MEMTQFSRMSILRYFNAGNKFIQPTDEEISAMLGGIPVYSFKPENLPHWDSLMTGKATKETIAKRAVSLRAKALRRHNAFSNATVEDLESVASAIEASAYCHAWVIQNGNKRRYSINCICIARPSDTLSPLQHLSKGSGIPPQDILYKAPTQHYNYIIAMHEIGHLRDYARKLAWGMSQYNQERRADTFALQHYRKNGGSEAIIKDFIAMRALGTFLLQPVSYATAPALKEVFVKNAGMTITGNTVQQSYAELRLRSVINKATPGVLNDLPSEIIHESLKAQKSGKPDAIQLSTLRSAKILSDTIWQDRSYHYLQRLNDLEQIMTGADLSPLTRECGDQILEAAAYFCPQTYKPGKDYLRQRGLEASPY